MIPVGAVFGVSIRVKVNLSVRSNSPLAWPDRVRIVPAVTKTGVSNDNGLEVAGLSGIAAGIVVVETAVCVKGFIVGQNGVTNR